MSGEPTTPHVAYRAVLLAAGLLLFGLLFRQLVTLLLAMLVTVIISIPLADAATKLERRGVPRAAGALLSLLGAVALVAVIVALLIPPFIEQTQDFVDDVPGITADLEGYYADLTGQNPGQVGDRVEEFAEKWTEDPERLIGPITSIGAQRRRDPGRSRAHPDHRLLHGGAPRTARRRTGQPRPALAARPRAPLGRAAAVRLDRLDAGGRGGHDRHRRPACSSRCR